MPYSHKCTIFAIRGFIHNKHGGWLEVILKTLSMLGRASVAMCIVLYKYFAPLCQETC